ncbi:SAVED domain-containing protein [Pseudomonas koreensis]|uniref:SAVED domain-containing protein n=1 Tax=Pseudomonas koreensis TaxID=198620 RepID=UPI0018E6978A|nr:SAVED domain-containing protein [Pseudomonas koreensis]MBI6949355.1 SAVED domain-containing protein [Pseudomonas koreensis]
MRNIWSIAHKLIDWIVRPRSAGIILITKGTLLIALCAAGGFVGKLFFSSGNTIITAQYDSAGGALSLLTYLVAAVGVLMVVSGVYIHFNEQLSARRKKILVIEQRGLFPVDTPLSSSLPPSMKGTVEAVKIDVREGVKDGKIIFPEIALQKVVAGIGDFKRRIESQDTSDIEAVYGGLMAVPLTFLTGCLLDDESSISVFDWDRLAPGRWRKIENGNDDGQRLQTVQSIITNGDEAVLALSISYEVDLPAIEAAFENIPIMHLRMTSISSSAHWSIEKQAAISQQFFDAVKLLDSLGVKTINLIIAAPNSVVFNLGRIYDRRNLPNAVVHQYEKTEKPAYPWGVNLPAHGVDVSSIVQHPKSNAVKMSI